MLEQLQEIVKLINVAENMFNSNADWEFKYDFIFGLKIHQLIRKAGLYLDWYDPDTTYEEDVTAYMKELLKFRQNLQGI